jgi:biopolymer transport protein ExbD
MQFRKRKARSTLIDITALIDVIFLLLIFFMISTTFITAPGIHVNLPTADSQPKPERQKPLEVTITEKNQFFLDGRAVEKADLRTALATAPGRNEATALIIKADGKVHHQIVVDVMDAAKQVGIHQLSIATRLPPPDKPGP